MITLRDYTLGLFIKRHYRGKSPDVVRGYKNAIERFDVFMERASMPSDLTPEAHERFRDWLEANFATVTKRGTMFRFRTVWRALLADGLVKEGPPPPILRANPLLPKPRESKRKVAQIDALENLPIRIGEKPTTLRQYIRHYALERGLQRASEQSMHHALNSFEKPLGREATLDDFQEMPLNLWLAQLLTAGLKPETVKGYRKCILALWRGCYEAEYIDRMPRRVRKIKCPSRIPQCWTQEQIVKLLNVARGFKHVMKNDPKVRASDFWCCFIGVGYSSGLRKGDLLALEWDQIDANGVLTWTMAKTGDTITRRLPPSLVALLRQLRPEAHTKVFGDILGRERLTQMFRRIAWAARVPGSIKWLRRSGATHCELSSPGSAKGFLGHKTFGLAERNYLDPRILQANVPMPPALDLVGT